MREKNVKKLSQSGCTNIISLLVYPLPCKLLDSKICAWYNIVILRYMKEGM